MSKSTFSISSGSPAEITDVKNPTSPSNPGGIIGIQNNGTVVVTVKGKLIDQASYATLGTVAAETIGGVAFIPGLIALEISVASGTATGIVIL